MYKLMQRGFLALFLSLFMFSIPAHAAVNQEEIFAILQNAYEAQISLGSEERPMEEVKEILAPYFTQHAEKFFLDENLFEENSLYFTLGTDNPFYYIPNFSYNDETKIVEYDSKLYVYQFYPAVNEGPVTYADRYDGVVLTYQVNSYKVSDFLYNINPSEITEKNEGGQNGTKVDRSQLYSMLTLFSEMSIAPFSNSIKMGAWWMLNDF